MLMIHTVIMKRSQFSYYICVYSFGCYVCNWFDLLLAGLVFQQCSFPTVSARFLSFLTYIVEGIASLGLMKLVFWISCRGKYSEYTWSCCVDYMVICSSYN